VAKDALEAIEVTIKDGVSSREVEEVADLIHDRGYTILDDLLHGVNQTPPIIQTAKAKRHASREVIFRTNMAITVQPNVMTLDERMGLQFGETFIVGKGGLERLNHYPREWVVCAG
jgi:Xaa-Pro aminopeptidase